MQSDGGAGKAPSLASSAAAAAAVVNAAVSSSERVSAPTTRRKSLLSRSSTSRSTAINREVDADGLPETYDQRAIEAYWRRTPGSLRTRWGEFLAVSVPFFTRVARLLVTGGASGVRAEAGSLARDARLGAERLGPTFVKAGQMLSARPDVVPSAAAGELALLQDAVAPFDDKTAREIVEQELGVPFEQVFSSVSPKPVAAASLAQVYRATLAGSGEAVALKVQRPQARQTVSKDLYVLRRAALVYQGVMERLAPQQRTDYVALLDEWAVGLYTELDFFNEAHNQMELRRKLVEDGDVLDVYVPRVYEELCTRRVLVSEWVDGTKLSACSADDLAQLVPVGQHAFLVQLFQLGLLHADPHPGNLLKLQDPAKYNGARLALLDFGLVARLAADDVDMLVNAVIHLANEDYSALIDDFISLGILPTDTDRRTVIPLTRKALAPYVKGGGAMRYQQELRKEYSTNGSGASSVGMLSAMTQDALTVLNDVPFSVPPYLALLGRAVVTLEGIALSADPDYALILSAYPFLARRLLREDRPQLQQALYAALYSTQGASGSVRRDPQATARRLGALVAGALRDDSASGGGGSAKRAAFLNLDQVADDSEIQLADALQFLLSEDARSLRNLLRDDADAAIDVLFRQAVRKGLTTVALPRWLDNVPLPILLPPPGALSFELSSLTNARPLVTTPNQLAAALAPPLDRDDQLFARALADATRDLLGAPIATIVSGDVRPRQLAQFVARAGSVAFDVTRLFPNDVTVALRALPQAESEVLRLEMQSLFERLVARCVDRLLPLA